MAKILYNTSTQETRPYPRDDDQPVIGLAAPWVGLTIIETSPPSYDPKVESLEEFWTANIPLETYTQGWNIVAAAPDITVYTPNYSQFQSEILRDTSFNNYIESFSSSIDSRLVISAIDNLPITGNLYLLQQRYNKFRKQANPKLAERKRWQSIATNNNIKIIF